MDNLSSVKNIMQMGYGRCANANNNLGLGTAVMEITITTGRGDLIAVGS
jgi:hypothetical protein